VLCGVSHAAPYKHFKSKEELIIAIADEVRVSFKLALEEAVCIYPDNYEMQIIEMGKRYVKFMVENPDYFKFLFLSSNKKGISILHESDSGINSYSIFEKSATNYLESLNANSKERDIDILVLWSIIHGYTLLLVNNNISFPNSYMEVVEKMIREKLNFK
jgi:AcrR family transcriptional regulator